MTSSSLRTRVERGCDGCALAPDSGTTGLGTTLEVAVTGAAAAAGDAVVAGEGAFPLLTGEVAEEAEATGGAGAARTGVGDGAEAGAAAGEAVGAADEAAAVGDGAGRDGVNCVGDDGASEGF